MNTRVAIIGIIVEDYNSVDALNEILHENRNVIIGRMGIPYRAKNISVMSIAVDADTDTINAISGKIGKLSGVSAKTAISGTCICD